MKKTALSLIAGLIVVFLIIVLNSLCAGCVYAQDDPLPGPDRTIGFAFSFMEDTDPLNSCQIPVHSLSRQAA